MPVEDEERAEPKQEATTAEPGAMSKASPAVLIAVVGALSGLLGSGITSYMNLRTESQKSLYDGQTQAQKSADDLKAEHERAAAQLAVQQNQAQAQIDLQRFQSEAQLKIEKLKVEGTLGLEKEKQDASAKLEKQEFETKLIMQAVQGVPPEVATKNLQFFLTAGFISDPDNKIAQLSVKAPPAIPAPGSSIVLSSPKACTELDQVDFKGAATPMTATDLQDVAASVKVEPAALQAVLAVETTPHGFVDGRPYIRFYAFVFSSETAGKYDASNLDLVSAKSELPGKGGVSHQYDLLREAMALDCGAALASTEWGMAGLTGLNYKSAGFSTVDDFIRTQMTSERAQLDTLARYLTAVNAVEPLQKKDWTGFLRQYLGTKKPRAAEEKQLAAAYEKFKAASQ